MKAILVIDVPVNDTTDFGHKDIRADVKIKAYNDSEFKEYELKYVRVEHIPKKRDTNTKDALSYERGYADGYNFCIDIISGEE